MDFHKHFKYTCVFIVVFIITWGIFPPALYSSQQPHSCESGLKLFENNILKNIRWEDSSHPKDCYRTGIFRFKKADKMFLNLHTRLHEAQVTFDSIDIQKKSGILNGKIALFVDGTLHIEIELKGTHGNIKITPAKGPLSNDLEKVQQIYTAIIKPIFLEPVRDDIVLLTEILDQTRYRLVFQTGHSLRKICPNMNNALQHLKKQPAFFFCRTDRKLYSMCTDQEKCQEYRDSLPHNAGYGQFLFHYERESWLFEFELAQVRRETTFFLTLDRLAQKPRD